MCVCVCEIDRKHEIIVLTFFKYTIQWHCHTTNTTIPSLELFHLPKLRAFIFKYHSLIPPQKYLNIWKCSLFVVVLSSFKYRRFNTFSLLASITLHLPLVPLHVITQPVPDTVSCPSLSKFQTAAVSSQIFVCWHLHGQ